MHFRPRFSVFLIAGLLAACGSNESGSANLDAAQCSAANLVDGGTYPQEALDALDARAATLPGVTVQDTASGCQVRSFDPNGTLLELDVLNSEGQPVEQSIYKADGITVMTHTTFSYDGGREVHRQIDHDGAGSEELAWSYTDGGAILHFQHDTEQFDWQYGANGQVQGWTETESGTTTRQVTYFYDAGTLTHYLSDDKTIGETFQYAGNGALSSREYSAGQSTQGFEYDDAGRIAHFGFGGAHMGSTGTDYTYNAAGCIESKHSATVGSPQDQSLAERWTYEKAACGYRVFAHQQDGGISPAQAVVTRSYDATGALVLEEVDLDSNCQPDGSHQLLRDAKHVLREERFDGELLKANLARRTFTGPDCPAFPDGFAHSVPPLLHEATAPYPSDWDLFWQIPAL